jgi:hypothetical protein
VPKKSINENIDKSYHEVTPTLPFSKEFTEKYKLSFLKDYVLNKERLLKILPVQMKHFTEDELNQKYSSYFPSRINKLTDVLKIARIKENELKIKCLDEKEIKVPNLQQKIQKKFPRKRESKNAVKLLLINISTHFTKDQDISEYDVLEPSLGLITLLSYANYILKEKIKGKIIKSRVDFDSYEELNKQINDFDPDIIGVSTMTFHKDFFHKAIKNIRDHSFNKMIIVGGPHSTTSFKEVLKDRNIDVCVIGEGEATIVEIIEKFIANNFQKLSYDDLIKIDGIAFSKDNYQNMNKKTKVQANGGHQISAALN